MRLPVSDYVALALIIAIAAVSSQLDWPAVSLALAAVWR